MPPKNERIISLDDFEKLEKKVNELQHNLTVDDSGIRMSCIDFSIRTSHLSGASSVGNILESAKRFYDFITTK